MYFHSALFWYKLVFMAELIVSEALFVYKFARRPRFALRLTLSVSSLMAVAFAIPIVAFNAAWASVMFIFMFVCTLIALRICFDESVWNIVFCGIVAYTVEHIAYVLASSVDDVVSGALELTGAMDPYSAESIVSDDINVFISLLIYAVTYFVVYWASYYVLASRIHPHEDLRLGRTHLVILAGVIVLVDIVFNFLSVYNEQADELSLWTVRCYNMLTCLLALYLQFTQLDNKEVRTELGEVRRLMHEQQRQYELTKQSIDIINIKSHDLKYQIRSLARRNPELDADELGEIERALQIYQSVVKTGNEALDVILTEKSLLCDEDKICLTCIIDGKQLDFMRESDIYSLFGNALDNAIEAVRALEESKRVIGISVKRVENMVSVRVDNYCDKVPDVKDGLPRTTKEDKEYHGYGLVSMRGIVQKYGGTMTVRVVRNTFNLNIMFPVRTQIVS